MMGILGTSQQRADHADTSGKLTLELIPPQRWFGGEDQSRVEIDVFEAECRAVLCGSDDAVYVAM